MAVIDQFLRERPLKIIEELNKFMVGFEESEVADFQCYPNPFSDEIHVCFEASTFGVNEINIYDVLGRKVYGQACLLSHGINEMTLRPHLPAGVYVLKMGSLTQRIVRN